MFIKVDCRKFEDPATAAALVAIGGTAYGISEQRKASKAQKKSLKAQQRMSDLENARQRREQVRQTRAARADIIAQGENTGVAGSSGVVGGTSSVSSQMGTNLSFLDQMGYWNNEANIFAQDAASHESNAALGGAIGSMANSMTDWKKVGASIDSIFSK